MFKKLTDKYHQIPVQVKASLWFFLCSFLQKGISFITTPIFTRLLSTSEYGRYNVFNSWLNIFTVIVSLNLYYGVYVRGMVKYEDDRSVFSSSFQGLTLFLVIIWLGIYIVLRKQINELLGLTTIQMLLMLLMIWTTAVFYFWAAEQRVDFKYKKLVLVTLIVSVAKPVLGISFVRLSKDKVTARILAISIVEVIGYTGFFIEQMKRGKIFFSAKYWKHALAFNIPLIPHYLSTTILNSSDRIMIERIIDSSSAGIYSLAYNVSMIMTMVNTALMNTIEPWLYKRIKEKTIKNIAVVAYPSLIIIAVSNIVLIAFAPEAIALFAPSSYYEAIYIIPPVAMSVFFMFSYTFFAVFEFYYKKTSMIALATSAGAVLNIILNYFFIRMYGYKAAGYTTLLCYIIYGSFHFFFMRKICNENFENQTPFDYKVYFLIAAAFLVTGFIFLLSYNNPVLRYGLIIMIIIMSIILKNKIYRVCKQIINIRKEG